MKGRKEDLFRATKSLPSYINSISNSRKFYTLNAIPQLPFEVPRIRQGAGKNLIPACPALGLLIVRDSDRQAGLTPLIVDWSFTVQKNLLNL